jgi:hypothetical protein
MGVDGRDRSAKRISFLVRRFRMSVFKKFAEEEQCKAQTALQRHAEAIERAEKERAEFRRSVEPHFSKVKEFLEAQVADLEGTPFVAMLAEDSKLPSSLLRLTLRFSFKGGSKQFSYSVTFKKDDQVTANLFEIRSPGGPTAVRQDFEERFGPADHQDLVPRIEQHLSKAIKVANQSR